MNHFIILLLKLTKTKNQYSVLNILLGSYLFVTLMPFFRSFGRLFELLRLLIIFVL